MCEFTVNGICRYISSDQHTLLGERIVTRDGLPRGVLPSVILKTEKYCPGLKVWSPNMSRSNFL